jgi:DNA polymerase III epsilon subunit-like protein
MSVAEGELFAQSAAETPVPWWRRRMLGLDLETTSADPGDARVVSAAVALVGGGAGTWSHTWLVNPGCHIPGEATAVNGIHDEDVAEAPEFGDVAEDLLVVLGEAVEQRLAVVAFNATYDLTVLDRECRRWSESLHAPGEAVTWRLPDFAAMRVVDPMTVDRMIDKYRKGSRKLPSVCMVWEDRLKRRGELPADRPGILERERDGEHAAAADAIAACRLAWLLAAKGWVAQDWPEREVAALRDLWVRCRDDLDALHEWQRRWRWANQLELRELWRSQGNPKWAGVRPEWPVYPVEAFTG